MKRNSRRGTLLGEQDWADWTATTCSRSILVNNNPVKHTINDAAKSLRNTTLPTHVLHNQAPGHENDSYVDRTVDSSSGSIRIITEGHGTGPYPQANTVAGPVMFTIVDSVIRAKVGSDFTCQDVPQSQY